MNKKILTRAKKIKNNHASSAGKDGAATSSLTSTQSGEQPTGEKQRVDLRKHMRRNNAEALAKAPPPPPVHEHIPDCPETERPLFSSDGSENKSSEGLGLLDTIVAIGAVGVATKNNDGPTDMWGNPYKTFMGDAKKGEVDGDGYDILGNKRASSYTEKRDIWGNSLTANGKKKTKWD